MLAAGASCGAAPEPAATSAPDVATIAVSYSGLLGGAERVLLEMASGLEEPPLIACPPGPLADAARARGVGVFELRERSLELRRSPLERAAAARRLAAQAAELRSLVTAVRPDTLVAWGMRAALSTSAVGAPPGCGSSSSTTTCCPGR